LIGFDPEAQAASPAVADVDGGELAGLDLMQNGLPGQAERGGCLVQGEPAVGCLPGDLGAQFAGQADAPGMNPSAIHR
jgi:hypothetical protein